MLKIANTLNAFMVICLYNVLIQVQELYGMDQNRYAVFKKATLEELIETYKEHPDNQSYQDAIQSLKIGNNDEAIRRLHELCDNEKNIHPLAAYDLGMWYLCKQKRVLLAKKYLQKSAYPIAQYLFADLCINRMNVLFTKNVIPHHNEIQRQKEAALIALEKAVQSKPVIQFEESEKGVRVKNIKYFYHEDSFYPLMWLYAFDHQNERAFNTMMSAHAITSTNNKENFWNSLIQKLTPIIISRSQECLLPWLNEGSDFDKGPNLQEQQQFIDAWTKKQKSFNVHDNFVEQEDSSINHEEIDEVEFQNSEPSISSLDDTVSKPRYPRLVKFTHNSIDAHGESEDDNDEKYNHDPVAEKDILSLIKDCIDAHAGQFGRGIISFDRLLDVLSDQQNKLEPDRYDAAINQLLSFADRKKDPYIDYMLARFLHERCEHKKYDKNYYELITRSADKGFSDAAVFLLFEKLKDEDTDKIPAWLRLACEDTHVKPEIKRRLIKKMLDRSFLDVRLDEIIVNFASKIPDCIAVLDQGCNKKNPRACFLRAKLYEKAQNVQDAINLYLKAIDYARVSEDLIFNKALAGLQPFVDEKYPYVCFRVALQFVKRGYDDRGWDLITSLCKNDAKLDKKHAGQLSRLLADFLLAKKWNDTVFTQLANIPAQLRLLVCENKGLSLGFKKQIIKQLIDDQSMDSMILIDEIGDQYSERYKLFIEELEKRCDERDARCCLVRAQIYEKEQNRQAADFYLKAMNYACSTEDNNFRIAIEKLASFIDQNNPYICSQTALALVKRGLKDSALKLLISTFNSPDQCSSEILYTLTKELHKNGLLNVMEQFDCYDVYKWLGFIHVKSIFPKKSTFLPEEIEFLERAYGYLKKAHKLVEARKKQCNLKIANANEDKLESTLKAVAEILCRLHIFDEKFIEYASDLDRTCFDQALLLAERIEVIFQNTKNLENFVKDLVHESLVNKFALLKLINFCKIDFSENNSDMHHVENWRKQVLIDIFSAPEVYSVYDFDPVKSMKTDIGSHLLTIFQKFASNHHFNESVIVPIAVLLHDLKHSNLFLNVDIDQFLSGILNQVKKVGMNYSDKDSDEFHYLWQILNEQVTDNNDGKNDIYYLGYNALNVLNRCNSALDLSSGLIALSKFFEYPINIKERFIDFVLHDLLLEQLDKKEIWDIAAERCNLKALLYLCKLQGLIIQKNTALDEKSMIREYRCFLECLQWIKENSTSIRPGYLKRFGNLCRQEYNHAQQILQERPLSTEVTSYLGLICKNICESQNLSSIIDGGNNIERMCDGIDFFIDFFNTAVPVRSQLIQNNKETYSNLSPRIAVEALNLLLLFLDSNANSELKQLKTDKLWNAMSKYCPWAHCLKIFVEQVYLQAKLIDGNNKSATPTKRDYFQQGLQLLKNNVHENQAMRNLLWQLYKNGVPGQLKANKTLMIEYLAIALQYEDEEAIKCAFELMCNHVKSVCTMQAINTTRKAAAPEKINRSLYHGIEWDEEIFKLCCIDKWEKMYKEALQKNDQQMTSAISTMLLMKSFILLSNSTNNHIKNQIEIGISCAELFIHELISNTDIDQKLLWNQLELIPLGNILMNFLQDDHWINLHNRIAIALGQFYCQAYKIVCNIISKNKSRQSNQRNLVVDYQNTLLSYLDQDDLPVIFQKLRQKEDQVLMAYADCFEYIHAFNKSKFEQKHDNIEKNIIKLIEVLNRIESFNKNDVLLKTSFIQNYIIDICSYLQQLIDNTNEESKLQLDSLLKSFNKYKI